MILSKSFFGTKEMPHLEIDEKIIKALAKKSVQEKQTVTGVQKKLSLNLHVDATERLTLVDYPVGYIMKPQTEEYPALPEAEDLVMDMAKIAKIKVVPHGLMKACKTFVYITKRIDRNISRELVEKYAMEDFCQLSEKLTENKYQGSYEKCVDIIDEYSSYSGADKKEFFMRVLFSFITGNSDMHLKNFSLIELEPGNREFVLSPAYDLLPVNIVNLNDDEELALTLNGKKAKIDRQDFMVLAEKCEMSVATANKIIDRMLNTLPEFVALVKNSEMPENLQKSFIQLMQERVKRIESQN